MSTEDYTWHPIALLFLSIIICITIIVLALPPMENVCDPGSMRCSPTATVQVCLKATTVSVKPRWKTLSSPCMCAQMDSVEATCLSPVDAGIR